MGKILSEFDVIFVTVLYIFMHHFLTEFQERPHFKTYISIILGTLLTALSVAGTYLTIVQGAYQLDAQTCALVGN